MGALLESSLYERARRARFYRGRVLVTKGRRHASAALSALCMNVAVVRQSERRCSGPVDLSWVADQENAPIREHCRALGWVGPHHRVGRAEAAGGWVK